MTPKICLTPTKSFWGSTKTMWIKIKVFGVGKKCRGQKKNFSENKFFIGTYYYGEG